MVEKKILILKLGGTFSALARRRGDFEDWIVSASGLDAARFHVVRIVEGDPLPEPATHDAVILTGSHDMVTDRAPWSERTAAWIPAVVASRVLLLGICYGHQLIAQAMGGRAENNPNGIEAGRVNLRLSPAGAEDPLFSGMPMEFSAFATHTQSVTALPPGAVALASSAMDPHHAFSMGKNVWGLQFHPEFNAEITSFYIREMADALLHQGRDPDAILRDIDTSAQATATILRRFGQIALAGGA